MTEAEQYWRYVLDEAVHEAGRSGRRQRVYAYRDAGRWWWAFTSTREIVMRGRHA